MTLANAALHAFVYRSCMALDEERYDDYLALFGEEGRYRVTTYSPELRKDMVWLDHCLTDLEQMIRMIPRHFKLPGQFFRQAVVYSVQEEAHGARVVSSLQLVYTNPDGESRLFAAGRYVDDIEERDGAMKLIRREVRLQTRDLGPGVHVPI